MKITAKNDEAGPVGFELTDLSAQRKKVITWVAPAVVGLAQTN